MHKILFIKSLFAPNKQLFDINTNSLIKLNIFMKLAKIENADLLLLGYVQQKLIKFLKLFLLLDKPCFSNVMTEYWNLNYGKYYLMNQIIKHVKQSANTYDLIIYMDHDIHIAFSSLKKFVAYIDTLSSAENLGLVAFNHKGDIRHQKTIYEQFIMHDNIKLHYSNNIGAIASGGYIIRPEIIKQLDDFELITVYGMDDYYLIDKLNKKGYVSYVMADCYIMHPYFKNAKYDMWKKENIINMINNRPVNYYQNIQDSINLWNL